MQCTVVVPAYNEQDYLPATLAAIQAAAAGLSCEIVVVDNASTDDSGRIATESGATVICESVHNIGRVRNTGAAHASGSVLVFVDADTIVPPALFRAILDAMRDERCFGGAVAVEYSPIQRTWMRWYLRGWAFWGKLFDMKQGAAQFCRKDAYAQIGGYDETIFVGEDIEFYWRLARHARLRGGSLTFVEHPCVVTSSRRFDKMSVWKTLLFTHPVVIWLNWKRRSFWRDWYEEPIR